MMILHPATSQPAIRPTSRASLLWPLKAECQASQRQVTFLKSKVWPGLELVMTCLIVNVDTYYSFSETKSNASIKGPSCDDSINPLAENKRKWFKTYNPCSVHLYCPLWKQAVSSYTFCELHKKKSKSKKAWESTQLDRWRQLILWKKLSYMQGRQLIQHL